MRMVFSAEEVEGIIKRHMCDNLGISESAIGETVRHTTKIDPGKNSWVLDEVSVTVFTKDGIPNQGPYRTPPSNTK